ncbi:hypothetical protein ACIB24_09660 [Spongisporangium articulatum]|uniref:Uncharacterized protein n=1 Tax=Spongisporangium articulatum TaxID=3362603 RepID=A0ABW8ALU6_9ACTN
MSTITISFDPDNPVDVAQARAIFDRLTETPATNLDPDVIRQKVIALLRGYGTKRTEYIRLVAQAAPGAAQYEDLVAVVGNAKAVGGTHSAIERAWRAKGMAGPFVMTDDFGNSSMDPVLADIVLNVIHDVIDEPDPLVAATF